MPKPSITKRTTKGAALTYSELDTNFQNLADATVSLTAGTAGTQVTADLNGNITLVAGSGVSITGDNTAKTVTITSTANLTPAGSNSQIQFNNSGALGASANLTWDGTNLKATYLQSTNSSGDEGGEIVLNKAATNTTINTSVTIDVYQNKLRFFETGGTNRGGYFDIPTLDAGAATDLGAKGLTNPLTSNLTLGNYKIVDSNSEVTLRSTQGLIIESDLYSSNAKVTISPGSDDVAAIASIQAGNNRDLSISTNKSSGSQAVITLDSEGDSVHLFSSSNSNFYTLIGSAAGSGVLRLLPMTTTERNARTYIADGMIIYNSSTNKFQGRAGGVWVDLH